PCSQVTALRTGGPVWTSTPGRESFIARRVRYARMNETSGRGQGVSGGSVKQAVAGRIRHQDPEALGPDHPLVAKLDPLPSADLTAVQLRDEGHVLLKDAIAIRLRVTGVGDARALLLQADPVDHDFVALLHELSGSRAAW